ncbi:MAG: hypothetical protein V1874_17450 [Spirochaetota bacterium]
MRILFYSIILSIILNALSLNTINNKCIMNRNASANYLHTPNSGYETGSFILTSLFDPALKHSAIIKVTLDPAIGSAETIDFCLNEESNSYNNPSIPSGYYFLTVQLIDNGIVFGGAAELIKIFPDATTKRSIKVSISQSPFLEITPRTDNIKLSFDSDKNIISSKKDFIITGSTLDTSNIIYTWFVDGILAASGINIYELTIPNDIVKGYHRIDLSILSIDGLHGGNATQVYNFQ